MHHRMKIAAFQLLTAKKLMKTFIRHWIKRKFSFEITAITTIDIEERAYQTSILTRTKSNDLPPPIFGRELLHTIHQLKIDTPVC